MTGDRSSTVVVGVDGSPGASAATSAAEEYARALGASLTLVTAWEWPAMFGADVLVDSFDPRADAQAVAEKAAASLSLPADRVNVEVRQGSGGTALVDASREAHLLVVGRRGHSPIANVLLGSVSNYCVHHAHVPVLVVPTAP
jgi:nucleotide-binding universal stress UspA family protein